MRRKKTHLRARVNQDLAAEATEVGLTSYAGLEVLRHYLQRTGLNRRLRSHLGRVWPSGDFGVVGLCRLLMGLLLVGGRRLRHVRFLQGDPLVLRFCSLRALPSDRSLSRWLQRCSGAAVEALRQLNVELVTSVVGRCLRARTLTIDVDGTVVSTGLQVGGARRGYNPHRRKVPSYYPITAFLADSGHLLRLDNRPGNVGDGSTSPAFLEALFAQLAATLGPSYGLRFRMDGDYFKEEVFAVLEAHAAGYAIKAPFWRCLDLHGHIQRGRGWRRVADQVDGLETRITVAGWQRTFRVVIYRKRVFHPTRKNHQLDLFDPDDGTWEYSAVATNLQLGRRGLWHFMCGRGLHEKTIGELKSGLALDTIPTQDYQANSAWQQLVVLTHNLLANFQIETGLTQRHRTRKSTTRWALQSVSTLRFELINRAGRLVRPRGRLVLRLPRCQHLSDTFHRITAALKKAA